MKLGDLVKLKFESRFTSNSMTTEPAGQAGLVVEMAENACKVMWHSRDGIIRSHLKSSLEVVSSIDNTCKNH